MKIYICARYFTVFMPYNDMALWWPSWILINIRSLIDLFFLSLTIEIILNTFIACKMMGRPILSLLQCITDNNNAIEP